MYRKCDTLSYGVIGLMLAGGVVLTTIAAAHATRPVQVAHTEQGDFTLTAPTAQAAQAFAAECVLAGASVEWVNATTFRLKFPSSLWGWWYGCQPRLAEWIVSGGASGTTSYIVSLGAEG